jgi:hypothetical protein
MAILVSMPIAKPRSDCIAFRRNRVLPICLLDVVQNLSSSVCFVSENITVRQITARQKFYSHCGIIDIPRSKQKFKRIPQCICKRMNFGVQTAFRASYGF